MFNNTTGRMKSSRSYARASLSCKRTTCCSLARIPATNGSGFRDPGDSSYLAGGPAALSFFLLVAAAAVGRVRADDLQLVRDGRPVATIVTADHPTPAARLAARELQHHIEEITGALLPIRHPGDTKEGIHILVGESAATRALGLKGEDFRSQEYLIRVRGDTIVLMGRDWIDSPANRREIGRGMQYSLADARKTIQYNVAVGRDNESAEEIELPGLMDQQGTCYAAYDFLERFCDVRWYGPSLLNIVIPSRKTLTVPLVEIRRTPSLLHRYAPGGGWPILREQWGPHHGIQKELFLRRIRYGGERWACNHAFASYRDRFLVKNPDRPELYEGSRPEFFAVGWENEGFWRQLCMTNPDVIAQVVRDARAYFDGQGPKGKQLAVGDYFAVVPEDSDHWCKCDRCQAILRESESRHVPGEFGSGLASDYVFGFVNAVAKEVKKTHPDKFIATLAYHCYFYPPRFELESNIAVAPCLGLCYGYQKNFANEEAVYYDWIAENKRSGRRLHVWNYFHHPMERALIGGWKCFPCFMPDVISKWVKRYARDGVRGYYLCGVPQQLDYYLYMQTAFNAQTDYQALVDEFSRGYFGAAGPAMQAFYERISEINRTEAVLAWSEKASWDRLGTARRMEELGALMDRAVASASTDVEKRRVETWKKGVWDYMLEGRREYVKKKRAREEKEFTIAVYGTGVDDDHKLLADGAVDPHWRLVESSDARWKGPRAYVVDAEAAPVPPWPERKPDAKSKWIAPTGGAVVAPGEYIYEQTFIIDDRMDVETASVFGRFMGDDTVDRIEINGAKVTGSASFAKWLDFLILEHLLVGENRLRIVVENAGNSANPHGLQVEVTGFADGKRKE